jgi:hypothetical protein
MSDLFFTGDKIGVLLKKQGIDPKTKEDVLIIITFILPISADFDKFRPSFFRRHTPQCRAFAMT